MISQSEVNYLNLLNLFIFRSNRGSLALILFESYHNILWLQVSMDNLQTMQIVDSLYDLTDNEGTFEL